MPRREQVAGFSTNCFTSTQGETMARSARETRRYERLQQLVDHVVGKKLNTNEHILAWSFAQGVITPGGLMIYGAGSAFYMRQYVLVATNKQLFLLQLNMRKKYQTTQVQAFPFSKVRIIKIKQHALLRFAWNADVSIGGRGFFRFTYYPHRTWAQLDP